MNEEDSKNATDVESAQQVTTEVKNPNVAENSSPESVTSNGKHHFHVGEYDISVPNEKVSLVGVMASALVLIASLAVDEILDVQKKRGAYGFTLAVVAFVVAVLSFLISSKNKLSMYLNTFNFIWCFIGACVMTFRPGPYIQTGNGYFASWGLVIFAGISADPPGNLARGILDHLNATMDLGAAAIVFMVALATEFDAGLHKYKGEATYAIVIAAVTVALVLALTLYKYKKPDENFVGESILMIHVAIAWIIAAILVTFRGPFRVTGNGYFVAWLGAMLAFRASASAWRSAKK